ncbi:S41 family peptidase [Pseudoalteromonas spongiae]|uniref:S41 family peptidase n=1 Tax=Pseudoalteromonas spongiae TaxID=298657 RepID=UPI0037362B93
MKKIAFCTFLLPFTAIANPFDCKSEFEWLKTTFENNDAGFEYAVSTKGESSYKSHNAEYLNAVKKSGSVTECHQHLKGWLSFFRDGHIHIGLNTDGEEVQNKTSKIHEFNELAFSQYLDTKPVEDWEGVWTFSGYTLALKKEGSNYNAYVIESSNASWKKGQIKFTIHDSGNGTHKVSYYMSDHSLRSIDSISSLDKNHLVIGKNWLTLSRQNAKTVSAPSVTQYVELMAARKPLFKVLSNKTALLRIPSFDHSVKKEIDTVIKDNLDTILQTENLIIDIRGNGGGSDVSYEEILPIIYTNPIRTIGLEFLSTTLNNSRMLQFMEDDNFSDEDKEWAKESYKKLENRLGEFVNLEDDTVTVETFEHVHPLPKNVGVLIDNRNGSTAEQFLLAAKQSQKVKLFGVTTRGVLDISNMYQVKSPSKHFTLYYSVSKSFRIPEMAIDSKGIQPDYYIDASVPAFQWIDHTLKILETR